jgi:outer membrane lipoprotein-sorting protein
MRPLRALVPLIALIPLMVNAQTPEEKGLAIAVEADKRDAGFGDSVAELTMELRNKNGDVSIRVLRTKTLEMQGDGDKSMSIFNKPADVNGTAMLTFAHSVSADDQWLYLPALRRVKRISSANKSGPFMGSEFAYEDLSSQEVEKYRYRWLRDEIYKDVDCFVIERFPVYENSGYTRQEVWIDKTEYRMLKVEFYDRKSALLKTLTAGKYEKYLQQYWRAMELVMDNHQTGKMTRLVYDNYRFRTGLSVADFNRNALKRAR